MNKKNSILITGGTGLVGSDLTQSLLSTFGNVSVLYRERKLALEGINWIKHDIAADSIENLNDIISETDIVIHNAACVKIGNTQLEKDEIEAVNVNFTRNFLEKIANSNVKKVIFTSSFSIIKKPLPTIITEDSAIECTTSYSNSKYLGEEIIREYAHKYQINYNILRISSPVASDLNMMPDTVIKKWIIKSLAKENIQVFGSGSRTQDFISVSDVSRAYIQCIKNKNVSGTFNLASGTPISMLDLAKLITNKFGNQYEFVGHDVNEHDRWNIDVSKIKEQHQFMPNFTSKEAIENLLKRIN
ncbi:MAG TPA: NAD(P)-dependent oxidoreductase [Bacteroidia bacterium]|nr:NAD(P)-dependent oxidoreductase [Bacteroidia bacterium]